MTFLLKALLRDAGYRGIEKGEVKKVQDYIARLENMTERIENVSGLF